MEYATNTSGPIAIESVSQGPVGARKLTSLAIDEAGTIHIAYSDSGRLVYSRRGEEGWQTQIEYAKHAHGLSWVAALPHRPASGPKCCPNSCRFHGDHQWYFDPTL